MNHFAWLGAFLLIFASMVDAKCYVTNGEVRILANPNSHSTSHGKYKKGSCIIVLCRIHGEIVNGVSWWVKTKRGYVPNYYVEHMSFDDKQPGDLIFWADHVAVYMGENQVIEVPDGSNIVISPVHSDTLPMVARCW
ncbi:hypothetical protein BC936DRAFT_141479 [Jimgerdemannia flammicorona]|uniref:NlpC/P60 domain-containing protein n=1 Tax=Jimgerdemannia flammicorona TaxID=994334 RepID=A0A433DG22_9FUNG|nr:hypothetical protein BC936DRAFT_141479 [Jimgerdemannia flammicorona]